MSSRAAGGRPLGGCFDPAGMGDAAGTRADSGRFVGLAVRKAELAARRVALAVPVMARLAADATRAAAAAVGWAHRGTAVGTAAGFAAVAPAALRETDERADAGAPGRAVRAAASSRRRRRSA